MRVFLRNKKTRLYCAGANGWAAAIGQAVEFDSIPQATRFAIDGRMPETEVVVRCDLLAEEVALPLLPEWRDLEQPRSAAAASPSNFAGG
jgi:hypothetical protein